MINIKSDVLFHVSEDSWLQISPSGQVTYRLNSKFLSLWNRTITTIGKDAARIAASYTPFDFFRGAWDARFEYASRGMVSSILVYNKLVGSSIKYRSQFADSGRQFNFSVAHAIGMLEKGRKPYTIKPKSAHGWLTGGYNKKGRIHFTRKPIEVKRNTLLREEPVTNAAKYIKTEVNNFFAHLRSGGINKEFSSNFQFKRGNYRGGTGKKTSGKMATKYKTRGKYASKRYKNFRNGSEE